MAYKAQKVCRWPPCHNLTSDKTGYCLACKKRRQDEYEKCRPPSSRRGFDSTWRRLREMKLADTPICELCQAEGYVTAADVVHHLDGDHLNNDWANLQSLCRHHHESIHTVERFKGKKETSGNDNNYPPSL